MATKNANLEQASASDEEGETSSEDPSSSDLPPSKMKGDKPNPLRRWAMQAES